MSQIFTNFGVQPVLLLAQVVNFLILLYILKRFLYTPILKVLQERRQKIAESLKNAEEIQKQLAETEKAREKKLKDATNEARQLLEEATKSANEIIQESHLKASADLDDILRKGRESIQLEREKMQNEIREELADLVAVAMEKVANKVLTEKDKKELVEKTVRDL